MRSKALTAVLLSVSIIEGGVVAEATSSTARAPTATAAAKQPRPLCRRNFVPVKRGRGYRCVALRVPRATSDIAAIRAVTAAEPRWPHKYAATPAVQAALNAADKRVLTAMSHALNVVARLKPAGATRAAASALSPSQAHVTAAASAAYDTGWNAEANTPGWEGRESGSVKPASGQPPGTTRTTNVEERGPDRAYDSRKWTSTVKLNPCPDAAGKVRGSASVLDERIWERRGADGYVYRSEFSLRGRDDHRSGQ